VSSVSLPLFAIGGDLIITLLVLLGSFVVWIYNQIKAAQQEQTKTKEKPRDLADQVRDVLQPQRREKTQPGRQPQSQRKTRPPVRPPQPSERGAPARQPLSQQESQWDRPVPVSQHVRRHMDTQEFEQRTGSLGQLSQLDDRVEEHVHAAFDHAVATIGFEGGATEEPAEGASSEPSTSAVAAAGVAAVLSDPDQLRNAIILQEILRPPTWE
jgi:hypothetical protein